MKIDLGKYIFNAFWFVTFVFATVALFFAIIPLNKLALKSDEFRIGEMQVESLGFSRGKGKGTAKRFLIGKINSMEKTIVLNEYQNVNAADIEVGSTTKVWFHDKFDRAFFVNNNNQKLVLPKLYFLNIRKAVLVLIPFILLSTLKFYSIFKKRNRSLSKLEQD